MSDRVRTAIVSLLLIVGYLTFGYLLLIGWIKPSVSGEVALVLVGGVFGVLTTGFILAVAFELGSSAGSRSKDALIAGQLPPPSPPVIVPQLTPPLPPAPAKPAPTPPTASPAKMLGITATVFSEAEPDNQQVAYPDVTPGWSNRPSVALPFHFHGVRPKVQVWGPKGSVVCEIVDVGPWYDGRSGWPADPYWQVPGSRPHAESDSRTNGAAIDLSPAAATAIGISGKGKVDWAFAEPLAPAVPASPAVAGEPLWLTLGRAEIGFHELPDNHGIQKYMDLAGYGADGEPWCAIFAGAMLRKAGIDIKGVNAMARSFSTAPSFTKIDAPRLGAIAVFWRGSQSGTEGHVGFYVGDAAPGRINVLGGNENDQVEIESIPISGSTMGLLGYWWPASPPAEPKVT